MNRRGFLRGLVFGALLVPLFNLRDMFKKKETTATLDADYVGYVYAPYIPVVVDPLVVGRVTNPLTKGLVGCWLFNEGIRHENVPG